MTTLMTNGLAFSPASLPPLPSKSEAPRKPDRTAVSGDVNVQSVDDEKQETLQEMLDDFKKMIAPWDQEIWDYDGRMQIRDGISLDIDAAEKALQDYLAGHPDRTEPIDFSDITVTLPETSSLRTADVKTKTFQDLMTYYKNTYKEFKLPDLPTSELGLDRYLKAMDKAADVGSLPEVKNETIKVQQATIRRQEILEAMMLLAEKYCEAMKNMLAR